MDGVTQAQLVVRAFWDAEARVWIAESEDIPGLVMEHPSFDALMDELPEIAAILLDSNGRPELKSLPIHVLADRIERTPA